MMKKNLFASILLSLSVGVYAAQITPVPDVSPRASGQYVVINIPQQRLFLYENGSLKKVYQVGVGKAMTQTNLGKHKIGAKAFNPTWHIPKSIQSKRGDGIQTVPPGPDNPLGPVFVRLGDPKLSLGIHGTNNPNSVPGVVSHGCVRMKSPDALEFAHRIHTGTEAVVSYELAALNQDDAGNLWLAAFRDPYNKKNLPLNQLKESISQWAAANQKTIAAAHIEQIIRNKSGKPVCLTCAGGKGKIQGDLKSIAWNSRSAKPTMPHGGMSVRPPEQDIILPEGTAIEIDAEAELDKFQGSSVFDTPPASGSTATVTPITAEPLTQGEVKLNPISASN